jgi:ribosomal protein S18 acetylase RimI-like enzyme
VVDPDQTEIRVAPPSSERDHRWLAALWRDSWGGEMMVSRGEIHHLVDLNALIAFMEHERVGAATYRIDGDGCELTSIDAIIRGNGIGSRLLRAVEAAACNAGCRRIWMITTNDNLEALRFYQRRGYRLSRLYPGAIAESRRIKPSISAIGEFGIPINDELELEKLLD